MKKLTIFTDGGARGNPGPAAIGVVIKDEKGKNLAQIYRKIGETTNNVAEYTAVVAALEWLRENLTITQLSDETMINFYLDSTLVVNQLNGLFKVKEGHLRDLLLKVRMLEQEINKEIRYFSVPREKNREADFLVNKALDNTTMGPVTRQPQGISTS